MKKSEIEIGLGIYKIVLLWKEFINVNLDPKGNHSSNPFTNQKNNPLVKVEVFVDEENKSNFALSGNFIVKIYWKDHLEWEGQLKDVNMLHGIASIISCLDKEYNGDKFDDW